MLTKQQKLDVLSKAIDEGANIHINFHDLTQSNAASLTKEIAGMLNTPVVSDNRSGFNWYQTSSKGFKVNAFYDRGYMLEDVVRTIEDGVEHA